MNKLNDRPENYGIRRSHLDDESFYQRRAEPEQALTTAVTQAYNSVWYPSASGNIARKEIKSAGGEGGVSVIEEIRNALINDGELITSQQSTTLEALQNFNGLFFGKHDNVQLKKIRENFACQRSWPVIEDMNLLQQIVRAGVEKGMWCLFRMGEDDSTMPAEIYSREGKEVPLDKDLQQDDWALVTPQGAKQRGWTGEEKPPLKTVQQWVRDKASEKKEATFSELQSDISEEHGEVDKNDVAEAIRTVIQHGRAIAYKGEPEQQEKPEEVYNKDNSLMYSPSDNDVILTMAEASARGWTEQEPSRLTRIGHEEAQTLIQLLNRIGSFYNRGDTTTVDTFSLHNIDIKGGGKLRIDLENVSAEGMKNVGELLEVLSGLVEDSSDADAELDIPDPDDNCPFIKALKNQE